ncbi:hypothetical protein OESDEN_21705 [Oesophagostomum dentatum]|uniref:glucuronosyltransferase n=1 Tax=Oesophagostomum dentatum TaxID=61180 RepID=A0A0B1S5C3_OESDE|nr:hypothetical protein OESDEN_21705 [Oesophagostomum dentatum]
MDPVSYDLGIPAPPSYVPSIEESDSSDVMTFWERAYNTYNYLVSIVIHRFGTDLITKVFRKIDPNFPNVREIAANASLCFVNADEMFDFARPIIHKNIYIGGLGVGEPKPLNEEFESIMNKGKEGVIVVSMGTVAPFHAFPENIKMNFARVFKSMPDYHFVLKIAKGKIYIHISHIYNYK